MWSIMVVCQHSYITTVCHIWSIMAVCPVFLFIKCGGLVVECIIQSFLSTCVLQLRFEYNWLWKNNSNVQIYINVYIRLSRDLDKQWHTCFERGQKAFIHAGLAVPMSKVLSLQIMCTPNSPYNDIILVYFPILLFLEIT